MNLFEPLEAHAAMIVVPSLLIWLYLFFAHGKFWQSAPELAPATPPEFPDVDIVVPARDEAATIGRVLGSLIAQDFRDAFTKVDAIVTPTSPVPAFKLGERTGDPLQMYLADIYTVTGSLAGVPGISVPCGKIGGKLPVGLQVFGPPFGEGRVLQLAHAFEQAGGATL